VAVGSRFSEGTSVIALGDGRYEGRVDEVWNLFPLPQGGIVTALVLRAMAEELHDPSQSLRTLHTSFVAQVSAGEVDIDVELLRRGRSMSHLRGEIRNAGAARGHLTTGIFGAPRRGFEFTDLRPPDDVPPPSECRSFREPPPEGFEGFGPSGFWGEQVEGRSAIGHAPWDDYEPDRALNVVWYRFDDPPFLDDGTLDPLALVVLADTMPGAVGEIVGRSDRTWFAPSIDLTVHILDTCRSPWLMGQNTARFAGDGYASADMALWDCGPEGRDAPRLVAYATQLFLFTFPEQ
jgi:acyl-CoA thioesterase